MLQEYAIDPELAADPAILRTISGFFDFSNPRRISAFPEAWAKNVYTFAEAAHPKQIKHVEILLDHFRKTRCIRSFGRSYNDTVDWKKNTSDQQKAKPFHAVICEGSADYIASNEIHAANPKLKALSSWDIVKSYSNLSNWLLPLFRDAKKILIIDPYWSPYNIGYSKLFSSCFNLLNGVPYAPELKLGICTSTSRPKAVYSTGEENKFVADFMGQYVTGPYKIKISGSLLAADMHARYLITDLASYIIDHSFNVKDSETANIMMIPATRADEITKKHFPSFS